MHIFRETAPKYWNAGLPAIPLMTNGKRPAINGWQRFADTFPTQDEREAWLKQFPSGNVGLPMGPCSGLVAVDIDTDDKKVLEVLDRVLPPSPWVRVGKKGMIKVYRYSGERTIRIKEASGAMICEILSKGTQFVLPPSIHPDTNRPYTANCELVSVYKALPALPADLDKTLRAALKSIGIETTSGADLKVATFVPAGTRDNSMVSMAGLMARGVLRGERTLLEALSEMKTWVENFVEQVVGDPLTVEKAQTKLIEFLVRDVTREKRKALPLGWDEGLSAEDKEQLGLTFTEDDEVWDHSRIMAFLIREFERYPEFRSPDRAKVVNIALERIACAGPAISPLEEGMLLRYIAAQSAGLFNPSELKRQLVQIRRGDFSGENHAELAEAVLNFINEFGELRYSAGKFWQWKGAFWGEKSENEILKVIAKEFGTYPAAKRQSDHTGILRVMKALCSKDLRVGDTRGVNFANGFLNEDLELEEHSPDHGMTYVLPHRYLPELAGHMPMFNQFLQDSWSEDMDFQAKVDALQEAMGATLMSAAPKFQRAICLYGVAGSGKSQVTELLRGLLPEGKTSSIPPQDWGDKFLPAEMCEKVVNFAGELSEDKYIPGDKFKSIVVGEAIHGQFKNRQPFEFEPRCAQWFASNHLPRTRDTSRGFSRRWLFLVWSRTVPEPKRITNLAEVILSSEAEAILAWAMEGYRRLKNKTDYTLPASHEEIVARMDMQNNPVKYFLDKSSDIEIDPSGVLRISLIDLFSRYNAFRSYHGIPNVVNQQRFQQEIENLGFEIVNSSGSISRIEVKGVGVARLAK
ncbi:hypothetical protein GCM10023174_00790 [Chelativorans composti]|uniref:Phage/plasmid primase, P4 family n=1 Tax=Chelativorans composti TaxID=768533 RepID=A0ABW5DDZ9_9HYPH